MKTESDLFIHWFSSYSSLHHFLINLRFWRSFLVSLSSYRSSLKSFWKWRILENERKNVEPKGDSPRVSASQRISFHRIVKNCNHKRLGIYYLLSAFIFGISGTLISVLIRIELYSSGNRIISPENQNFYNISITLHGFLMIFFLVMPGLFGVSFGYNGLLISGLSLLLSFFFLLVQHFNLFSCLDTSRIYYRWMVQRLNAF